MQVLRSKVPMGVDDPITPAHPLVSIRTGRYRSGHGRFLAPDRTPRRLGDIIGAHLAAHPPVDGYVFTSPRRTLLRRTNFRRRVFLPAVRASVGEPVRFHDLRHSHVAALIAQGEHPKVIQTRLGHSSIKVTQDRYGHLLEGLDEAAAACLDDAGGALPELSRNKSDQTVIELRPSNSEP